MWARLRRGRSSDGAGLDRGAGPGHQMGRGDGGRRGLAEGRGRRWAGLGGEAPAALWEPGGGSEGGRGPCPPSRAPDPPPHLLPAPPRSWLHAEATVQDVRVLPEAGAADVTVLISSAAYGRFRKLFPG